MGFINICNTLVNTNYITSVSVELTTFGNLTVNFNHKDGGRFSYDKDVTAYVGNLNNLNLNIKSYKKTILADIADYLNTDSIETTDFDRWVDNQICLRWWWGYHKLRNNNEENFNG